MDNETVYNLLLQRADSNGVSQFDFSRDVREKLLQMEALKSLEKQMRIKELTTTLGYALYRIL